MVTPTRRSPRTVAAVLLAALALLAMASCGKKITAIDSSLQPPVYPEGRFENSDLLVYMDTPIRVEQYLDKGQPGPTPDDVLLSARDVYDVGPGTVIGSIIDSTDASEFDVFRQGPSGGYSEMQDAPLHPVKSWLASHTELYRFSDSRPIGSMTYVGRGRVDGLITRQAPLTNLAKVLSASVAGDLKYLGNVAKGFPDTTDDSLFLMRWQAVPGASGYWISVVGLTAAYLQSAQLYQSALPRPVFPERFPQYFVGFVPAPNTQYKLGDRALPGTRQLVFDTLLTANNYAVRIVAVNAEGQVLSYTRDDAKAEIALQRTDDGYITFPLGYVVVKTSRPQPPPALQSSARAIAGPFANLRRGEVMLVRRDQLRAAWRR